MKTIEVVAALTFLSKKLLCVQRGKNKYLYISEKWEFPGGKVEIGEDHKTALTREIKEELKIRVSVDRHILTVEHKYPDFFLKMHAYQCQLLDEMSKLTLTEHVAFQWISPSDPSFGELDWAAADLPIVRLLQKSF